MKKFPDKPGFFLFGACSTRQDESRFNIERFPADSATQDMNGILDSLQ